MNSSCTYFQQCCVSCFGFLKYKNRLHGFIYLFYFIAVSVCFPMPRDRKRRKGTHICATARVPSIHKTCPVASAEQKGKQCHQVKFLRIPWQIHHLIKRKTVGKDKNKILKKYIQSVSGTEKSPDWYLDSVSKAWLWGLYACGDGWNCERVGGRERGRGQSFDNSR